MKHILKYQINEDTQTIDDICEKYNIKNYTINQDGSIDVKGHVALTYMNLYRLPVKFNKVSGSFLCNNN